MRDPDLEIGGHESPYLRRWYLLPRNRVFSIYLHQMLRDDDDRALHDHPGANISVILRGGYDEVLFTRRPRTGMVIPPTRSKRRRPGMMIFRWAKTPHRLKLPFGVTSSWSLFVVFPKFRDWGFWCGMTARWVPWREFTSGPKGELIGKGCG